MDLSFLEGNNLSVFSVIIFLVGFVTGAIVMNMIRNIILKIFIFLLIALFVGGFSSTETVESFIKSNQSLMDFISKIF